MRRGCSSIFLALFLLMAGFPILADEGRAGNIDVVLLVDKSLSMADAEGDVKRYVAAKIIGPVIMPGDRLIIETFYGKIDRLYSGTVRTEEDKAAIVRSLNGIRPDGRFTDIGAALDRAKADLEELGSPERSKYVLLLTDERQEAPAGTKYYAPDYRLSHPALQFIDRKDLGSFRAIAVGFDVGSRIEASAPKVMRLLSEPPARKNEDFPELPPEAAQTGKGEAPNAPKAGQAPVKAPSAGSAELPEASGPAVQEKGDRLAAFTPFSIILASGLVFLLFLAVFIFRVVHLKNKKARKP